MHEGPSNIERKHDQVPRQILAASPPDPATHATSNPLWHGRAAGAWCKVLALH
jgi:hypothetical protein